MLRYLEKAGTSIWLLMVLENLYGWPKTPRHITGPLELPRPRIRNQDIKSRAIIILLVEAAHRVARTECLNLHSFQFGLCQSLNTGRQGLRSPRVRTCTIVTMLKAAHRIVRTMTLNLHCFLVNASRLLCLLVPGPPSVTPTHAHKSANE